MSQPPDTSRSATAADDDARSERAEDARKDKAEAAEVRTVTCVSCQSVVLVKDSHLTSYGVLCARCHDDD